MPPRRAGPDLEAGPEASAERSEGTMEARQGRDAAGGSMRYAHDSATGHVSWPGTPCVPAQRTAELGHEAYNTLEEFEGALLDEEVHRGRMGTGTYVVCPGYKRERLTIDAWPHAKSRITSGFFKNTVSAARRGRILNGGVQVGEVSKTSGSSNARRSHLSGDFPSPGSMSIGSRKYRTTFAADSSILEAIRQ